MPIQKCPTAAFHTIIKRCTTPTFHTIIAIHSILSLIEIHQGYIPYHYRNNTKATFHTIIEIHQGYIPYHVLRLHSIPFQKCVKATFHTIILIEIIPRLHSIPHLTGQKERRLSRSGPDLQVRSAGPQQPQESAVTPPGRRLDRGHGVLGVHRVQGGRVPLYRFFDGS